jgi:micrococcal nuclease
MLIRCMLSQSLVRRIGLAAGALFGLALAGPALADPCEAIQQSGPLPAWVKPSAAFAGRVRHVIDGDSLCIGSGSNPRQWVEVRLADFYAAELHDQGGQEAKALLQRLAAGREVECVVTRHGRVRSYDRIVAVCRLKGRSLSDIMRGAGVVENRP